MTEEATRELAQRVLYALAWSVLWGALTVPAVALIGTGTPRPPGVVHYVFWPALVAGLMLLLHGWRLTLPPRSEASDAGQPESP